MLSHFPTKNSFLPPQPRARHGTLKEKKSLAKKTMIENVTTIVKSVIKESVIYNSCASLSLARYFVRKPNLLKTIIKNAIQL